MSSNFFTALKIFFTNPIFLSGIFSWFIAQFLKTIINLIYGKVKSIRQLFELLIWRTGGMPSSHAATVSSVCTSIGFRSGFYSDVFFLSIVFYFITIRDAVGVRRSSGLQAHKLNEIGKELQEKGYIDKYKPIKAVDGHTPLQVIFGTILGILIGLSWSLLA